MLQQCGYRENYYKLRDENNEARDKEMIEFINIALEYNSARCAEAVFEMKPRIRPICLVNAIKFERWDLINRVYTELFLVKGAAGSECDGTQVVEYALKYDLVDIVEKCMKNKWYQKRDNNEQRALKMNAIKCYEMFKAQRVDSAYANQVSHLIWQDMNGCYNG